SNHPGTCKEWSIREDRLLPFLIRKLQDDYLAPKRLERLRKELLKQAMAETEPDPEVPDRLRAQVKKLDEEIRRATANVLRARDNLDLLNDQLSQLRREREELAARLDAVKRSEATPAEKMAKMVDRAVQKLARLNDELRTADKGRLRAVLRQMIYRIDLYFEEPAGRKKGEHFRFQRGVVKLRAQIELEGNVAQEGTL
ncbi:MAG TPA: DUF3135 domain-containing protein, partial [Gemmataceae bacterium]|nr:DUF3135 domain-containing protein [Gemmataceae bacterium]